MNLADKLPRAVRREVSGKIFAKWGLRWAFTRACRFEVRKFWTMDKGHTVQKAVRRRQFPMMAAHVFTDYRSLKGRLWHMSSLISHHLPTGTLSPFNLYVELSRSSGRVRIRLVRDFDGKLFMASHDHDPALVDEDERLVKHSNKIVVRTDS